MLQLEPQSVEGCKTFSHEGLANVNTEKNIISPLLYTFLSSTLDFNGNEALCYCILMGIKPACVCSFCVGAQGKCFARIKMCCCEMLIELTVSTGVDVNIIPL